MYQPVSYNNYILYINKYPVLSGLGLKSSVTDLNGFIILYSANITILIALCVPSSLKNNFFINMDIKETTWSY